LEVRDPNDLDGAFEAALGEGVEALVLVLSAFFIRNRPRVVELAAKSRLPAISGEPDFARAGGLMAYGPSQDDMWRRAATYVDKILKGAKSADLPIEQPTKFDFVINLKTARTLGLTIPQEVLMQATEVIQ
jgi:putative ABC transport system substrate-binding protein